MRKILGMIVILYLMWTPVILQAQIEIRPLSRGERVHGIGIGFLEDAISLSYILTGSIAQNATACMTISALHCGSVDDDLAVYGVSVPSVQTFDTAWRFDVKFTKWNTFAETGLDYWLSLGFSGINFERIITKYETTVTSRGGGLSVGFGFDKEITTHSGFALVPLTGIFYSYVWTAVESENTSFRETEHDGIWSYRAGLIAEVSSTVKIGGTLEFSESDISCAVNLFLGEDIF